MGQEGSEAALRPQGSGQQGETEGPRMSRQGSPSLRAAPAPRAGAQPPLRGALDMCQHFSPQDAPARGHSRPEAGAPGRPTSSTWGTHSKLARLSGFHFSLVTKTGDAEPSPRR